MKKAIRAAFAAGLSLCASAADVTITKPYIRWLFGGFGFQNSEANFTALMPDDFRDQRVLKTFAEISPTFGRVYTGFADQSKEQLDRFADYYDLQPPAGTVVAKDGSLSVSLPAKSITFLTTDYENHVPAAITDIRIAGGKLVWAANEEPAHRYYRVYKDGKQIASTVATSLDLGGAQSPATATDAMNCVTPAFAVKSVDKWGNVRQ